MSEPTKVAPWEDLVLRIIAIYKIIKSALALMLGLTLLKLVHHDINAFLHDHITEPFHLDSDMDSENHFVRWAFMHVSWTIQQVSHLTPHGIRMSAYASFFYAAVFAAEGVGLYLKKHWAEYMVVIVTGSFLPFEGYLLYLELSWWKLCLIGGNFLIIAYLVHRIILDAHNKRAALEAQQQADEKAAPAANLPQSERVASEVP